MTRRFINAAFAYFLAACLLDLCVPCFHPHRYDLGEVGTAVSDGTLRGEDLISLLQELDEGRVVNAGERGAAAAVEAVNRKLEYAEGGARKLPEGVRATVECVDWRTLCHWLG